jgi:prepilin-type N-terminal cleavage/methylation domain-containing protein
MTPSRPRNRLGEQGYTLIELLTVLVIIGILVDFAAPSIAGVLRRLRSREAVGQVVADLSYARLVGVRSGRGATVVFDGADRYRIKEGREPGATVLKTVDLSAEYSSVQITRPTGVDSIVYNSRGLLSLGSGMFIVQATGGVSATQPDTFHVTKLGTVRHGS